jgi:curved DNA-binding protein CbpA
MSDLPDYYAILGLLPAATRIEIRAAYRRLAKQHHPDANGRDQDDPVACQFMYRLNEAYEVLRDPERRAAYDSQRRVYPPPQPVRRSRTDEHIWASTYSDSGYWEQEPDQHAQGSRQPNGFESVFEPDWLDDLATAEEHLRAQFRPFSIYVSLMIPLLALSLVILLAFWLYVQVRSEPGSWMLLTLVLRFLSGPEGLVTLGAVLLVLALWVVWWRSSTR